MTVPSPFFRKPSLLRSKGPRFSKRIDLDNGRFRLVIHWGINSTQSIGDLFNFVMNIKRNKFNKEFHESFIKKILLSIL